MKILITLLMILFAPIASAEQAPTYIDVRSWAEHQVDNIEGDVRIPVAEITQGVLEQFPDKTQPLRLYCAVGGRASKAAQALIDAGYTDVLSIGGISDARRIRQLESN